jgi:hypothetical protein
MVPQLLSKNKANGSLRLCVDYRALNKLTVKNKYLILNFADLFDRLSKVMYFTKINTRSSYWQIRIAKGDEAKMTVVTRYGSYEFLVMPFRLTNAPATFYNLMNDVLYDYLDKFVVVYLDDIVIYSDSLKEHLLHLKLVFQRLRKHKLYVKKEKCESCWKEITFLGYVISQERIQMDRKKVVAIIGWTAPTKMSELRLFLDLANYYQHFIKGYSKLVAFLTDLLKKDQR